MRPSIARPTHRLCQTVPRLWRVNYSGVTFICLNVALPIFAGGVIYTCWRKPTLLMFSWYDQLRLGALVRGIRHSTSPAYNCLPHWILFSLPDALWVYSLTALMLFIWQGATNSKPKLLWVSIALLLGVGGEIGQAAGMVQGTFDTTDLILSVIAAVAAISANRAFIRGEID